MWEVQVAIQEHPVENYDLYNTGQRETKLLIVGLPHNDPFGFRGG